ncbi:MAG: hypothetical protein H6603_03530 [Flavobacteriales bacterium]|nr:hypothetical protein [Flavobacteriales bacterium]
MSRLLSILMIGLYGLTLSQAYMPHVNYWMNRDYISSVLCENKDQPELECNGKCHLKKEIQESTDGQEEGKEVSERMMVEFLQVAEQIAFVPSVQVVTEDFCNYCEPLTAGFSSSIFHPPKA